MTANESGGITYTVKELLGMLERTLTEQMQAIAGKLDGIQAKLETKAADSRVDGLESRIRLLEEKIAGTFSGLGIGKWLIASVGIPAAGIIATLVWLAAGGH